MAAGFAYFDGTEEEIAGLAEGLISCTFCGARRRCLVLPGQRYGCFDCLRRGRFHLAHDTEIGFVTTVGVERYYDYHRPLPSTFREAALEDLRRTPRYPTWQQTPWLVHCDDFMIYLGEWKPADFVRHAIDGDAKGLFVSMTAPAEQHLWDDAADGTSVPSDWYATYYGFRCRHCGVLRGNWDRP